MATRIDLFGVHDWRGEGSPIGMVAPLIEMAIWFSPLALFSTRAEDAPGSGWDVAFRIVVFGFLGLVAGFAAMVLSMLLTAMLLGEDAAAALFAFVIAVG